MSETPNNEQLLAMYANAVKTYYGAIGHGKTERNEQRAAKLKQDIEQRGLEVPTNDHCFKVGIFNGNGAV